MAAPHQPKLTKLDIRTTHRAFKDSPVKAWRILHAPNAPLSKLKLEAAGPVAEADSSIKPGPSKTSPGKITRKHPKIVQKIGREEKALAAAVAKQVQDAAREKKVLASALAKKAEAKKALASALAKNGKKSSIDGEKQLNKVLQAANGKLTKAQKAKAKAANAALKAKKAKAEKALAKHIRMVHKSYQPNVKSAYFHFEEMIRRFAPRTRTRRCTKAHCATWTSECARFVTSSACLQSSIGTTHVNFVTQKLTEWFCPKFLSVAQLTSAVTTLMTKRNPKPRIVQSTATQIVERSMRRRVPTTVMRLNRRSHHHRGCERNGLSSHNGTVRAMGSRTSTNTHSRTPDALAPQNSLASARLPARRSRIVWPLCCCTTRMMHREVRGRATSRLIVRAGLSECHMIAMFTPIRSCRITHPTKREVATQRLRMWMTKMR
jgi:hypothetical protein